MHIDECCHDWDFTTNEYLPIIESIRKHHPCKECGLIDNHPERRQLKTGALIGLIKEMFERYGIPRNMIRDHTENIKQMKCEGVPDDIIIDTILSYVYHESNLK